MSTFERSINPCILLSVIFSNASLFFLVNFLSVSILYVSDISEFFFVNLVFRFLSFLLVS